MSGVRDGFYSVVGKIGFTAIVAYPVFKPFSGVDQKYRTGNQCPDLDHVFVAEVRNHAGMGVVVEFPAVGTVFVFDAAVNRQVFCSRLITVCVLVLPSGTVCLI